MARIYLDTNILLHAKPLQDIPWEHRATPPITLVITTTNIRELDHHKDQHPKKHLRERARKALQRIEAALTQPTIREHVTIEINHQAPTIAYETHDLDPTHADDTIRRLQVKGRCLLERATSGQRIGRIDITKEFDAVLLVLLDDHFDAFEIYEAERDTAIAALTAPGSRARNERGALAVSKFKAIGKLRWRRS